MKILLVDDNALFLASAQRFLSNIEAVAVKTAKNGLDALEHLKRERPDLVLMDLNMPGMNGLEATRRIKALDPAIRVVVVSLWDAPEFQAAAARAGAESFVAKQDFTAKIPPMLGRAAASGDGGRP
jgi:DNA-binding NarL/FixJ family response regulator